MTVRRLVFTKSEDSEPVTFLGGSAAVATACLNQIIDRVPELKARATKVVFDLKNESAAPTCSVVLARTLMPGDVIGWTFDDEPEVACTVVEAIPVANGTSVSMRLTMNINGVDPAEVHTRWSAVQDEVTLISRAI